MKPGGWLVNADIVVAADAGMEQRIQALRVAAVTARAPAEEPRFRDHDATRSFLADLEAREHDQPQTLETDIRILRQAGLSDAEPLWREYREVVIAGSKPA